jgi:hypothetical protein
MANAWGVSPAWDDVAEDPVAVAAARGDNRPQSGNREARQRQMAALLALKKQRESQASEALFSQRPNAQTAQYKKWVNKVSQTMLFSYRSPC